jgi:endogenous inhibitor of DNA gyrase (YacG/DUF329 family)
VNKRPAPMVACPTCRRETAFDPANPWRPFCSQRCKTIDLGAWASGAYAIPGAPVDESQAQDPSPDDADQR